MDQTGVLRSLRNIWVREGLHGLYRGSLPTVALVFPLRAIYFTAYSTTKEFVSRHMDASRNSAFVHLASAAAAVVSVTSIMNPLFLMKTRIQLQEYQKTKDPKVINSKNYYNGYLDCARKVYKYEGLRGFYRGLTAAWLGIAETGLYFVVYEKAKQKALAYRQQKMMEQKGVMDGDLSIDDVDEATLVSPYELFFMSAVCKLFASFVTYPHEVLKTRMRERAEGKARYSGVIDAIKRIPVEEGWRSFYNGMSAHLLRVVPTTAITFFAYEWLVQKFSGKVS